MTPADHPLPDKLHVGSGEWHQLIAIYDEHGVYRASCNISYTHDGQPETPFRGEAIALAAAIVARYNAGAAAAPGRAEVDDVKALIYAGCKATAALQIALANLNPGVSGETVGRLNTMRLEAEETIACINAKGEQP